jgi:hypothetical protein
VEVFHVELKDFGKINSVACIVLAVGLILWGMTLLIDGFDLPRVAIGVWFVVLGGLVLLGK